MKVFTTVGFRTNHYYIVNDDGVIFASHKPFFDGDKFFKSAFSNEDILVSMCNRGSLLPYNKEAKDFVDNENRKLNKSFIHSRHFWCNVFIITVALIACVGFIFL